MSVLELTLWRRYPTLEGLVCLTHNLLKVWRYGCAPSMN
jgi:hypothetical protein